MNNGRNIGKLSRWMPALRLFTSLTGATALLAQHPGYNQIYNFGAAVGPTTLTGTGDTLYGATQTGGSQGRGTVYALTLPTTPGNPWTYTTLYEFGSNPSDGSFPLGIAIGGYSGGRAAQLPRDRRVASPRAARGKSQERRVAGTLRNDWARRGFDRSRRK